MKTAIIAVAMVICACNHQRAGEEMTIKESFMVVADDEGVIQHQIPEWEPGSIPMIQVWARSDPKFGYLLLDSVPMSLGADGTVYVSIEPNQDAIVVVMR